MTRVDFYHLQKQTLEQVLPKLLEKAYALGKAIKIKIGNEERVEFINSQLWTFDDTSFIPHGSKKDGFAESQPIWLSAGDDNPNHATLLFLVDGADISPEDAQNFERIFNIFDGNDENALTLARGQWKKFKSEGLETYYWQQEGSGKWIQKA